MGAAPNEMKWRGRKISRHNFAPRHAAEGEKKKKRGRKNVNENSTEQRTTFFVCAIERKLNEEIFVINEALLLCQEWRSLSTVGVGRDEQSSQLTCVLVRCCGDKSRSRRRIRSHQQCHLLECKKKFSFNDCLLSLMNPHSAAGTARAETFCAAGAFCDVFILVVPNSVSRTFTLAKLFSTHVLWICFAECRILKVILCSFCSLLVNFFLRTHQI